MAPTKAQSGMKAAGGGAAAMNENGHWPPTAALLRDGKEGFGPLTLYLSDAGSAIYNHHRLNFGN
jgi:hypothetical protein